MTKPDKPDAGAVLRELEWSKNGDCPVCGKTKLWEDHTPDCRLAAALAEQPALDPLPPAQLTALSDDARSAISDAANVAWFIGTHGSDLAERLREEAASARENDPSVGIFANEEYAEAATSLAGLAESIGGRAIARELNDFLRGSLPAQPTDAGMRAGLERAVEIVDNRRLGEAVTHDATLSKKQREIWESRVDLCGSLLRALRAEIARLPAEAKPSDEIAALRAKIKELEAIVDEGDARITREVNEALAQFRAEATHD